jgi:hypothetical protein
MRKQLERRLQELRTEFECGQKMLAELETKQTNVRNSMLRISGAIQVLEEELGKPDQPMEDDIEDLVSADGETE